MTDKKEARTIRRFAKDLFSDGYKAVGVAAPVVSILGSLVKLSGVDMGFLKDISYAWALLPIAIWLLIAYIRRRKAHIELIRKFASNVHPVITNYSESREGLDQHTERIITRVALRNDGVESAYVKVLAIDYRKTMNSDPIVFNRYLHAEHTTNDEARLDHGETVYFPAAFLDFDTAKTEYHAVMQFGPFVAEPQYWSADTNLYILKVRISEKNKPTKSIFYNIGVDGNGKFKFEPRKG